MAWRTVLIENPSKLSLSKNQLIIKQDHLISLPIEDIDTLIIDSYGTTLTSNLIDSLSTNKVNVIICDAKHHPSSLVLPYAQASRGAKIARAQITISEPFRKQLWQINIKQKITNQANVLEKFFGDDSGLRELARTVRSDDAGNHEALAARIYFSKLLEDATRRQPTWYNSALNYSYAIVRGSLARSVASHGLIASVGINHHSELNQFNLVDDLIECFRPIVDDFVLSNFPLMQINEAPRHLRSEDRHTLIDINNQYGIILDKRYKIKDMTNVTVESFIKAILNKNATELLLPQPLL